MGFYKGGYDDSIGNIWVCVKVFRCCIVILVNDVCVEWVFFVLVYFIFGEIGVFWCWEYGDKFFVD